MLLNLNQMYVTYLAMNILTHVAAVIFSYLFLTFLLDYQNLSLRHYLIGSWTLQILKFCDVIYCKSFHFSIFILAKDLVKHKFCPRFQNKFNQLWISKLDLFLTLLRSLLDWLSKLRSGDKIFVWFDKICRNQLGFYVPLYEFCHSTTWLTFTKYFRKIFCSLLQNWYESVTFLAPINKYYEIRYLVGRFFFTFVTYLLSFHVPVNSFC